MTHGAYGLGVVADQRQARATGFEPIYAGYFGLQAVVGILLWISFATAPAVRTFMDILPAAPDVTHAFEIADIGVIVVASGLAAWAIGARTTWATPMAAFAAGAVVYPTLYLVGWVGLTQTSSGVLSMMLAPATLSCWVAVQVYRSSRSAGPGRNL